MHSLATRGRRVTELTEGDSDLALETTPLSPRVRSNTEAAADGVRLDFGQRTRSKSIMSMKGASTPRRGGGGGAVGGVSCGCCPPEGSWCRNALAVTLLLLFVAATAVTAAVIVILLFPGSSTARNSDSGNDSGVRWVPIVSATAELAGFSSTGSHGMPFRQPEAEAFATAIASLAMIPAEDVGGLYWHFDTAPNGAEHLFVDFYVQLGRENGRTPDQVLASLNSDTQFTGFLNVHGLEASAAEVVFTSVGLVDASHLPGIWGHRDHTHDSEDYYSGGPPSNPDDGSEEIAIPEEELSALDVSVVFPESSGSFGRKLLLNLLQDAVRTNPDDVNVMYVRVRRCPTAASCPPPGVTPTPALHPVIVGQDAFTTLQKVFDGNSYVWRGRIGKLTPDNLAAGSQTRVFVDAARFFLAGYSNDVAFFSDADFAQQLSQNAGNLFSGVSNAVTLRSGQTTAVLIVLKELAISDYNTIGSVSISNLDTTNSGSTTYCDVETEDCTTGGGPDGEDERFTEVTGDIEDTEDGVVEYYWVVENAVAGGVEAYAIGYYDPNNNGTWVPCGETQCRSVCDGCDVSVSVVFTSSGCVEGLDVCTADLCLVAEDEDGGIAKQCTTITVREQASTVGLIVEVQNKPYVSSIIAYEDDSATVERGHFTAQTEWDQYCAVNAPFYDHQSCGIACQETLYLTATISDPDSTDSVTPTNVIDYQWFSDCAYFQDATGTFEPCLESYLSDPASSPTVAACRGQATRVNGAFPNIATTVKQVGTPTGYRDCVVNMVMDDSANNEINIEENEAYGEALSGTGSIQLLSSIIYIHETSLPLRLDYDLRGHVQTPGFESFESPRFRTSPSPQDQREFDVFNTRFVQHFKAVNCFQITAVSCDIVGMNDDIPGTDVFEAELVDTVLPFNGEGDASCRLRMTGECDPRRLRMTATQVNTAGPVQLPIYIDISCKSYGNGNGVNP